MAAAAPSTCEQFLEITRKSNLVEAKLLDAYLAQHYDDFDPAAKPAPRAKDMIKEGLLTHFQAEQLLQGKWRRFTINEKYRLLERLGSGGMGAVFLCEHMHMRRRVALKVLPLAKAKDPAALDRFYREARAVAALDHPNIVRAYDLDKEGPLHFLVMEYVDGNSLLHIVNKFGPMDVLRACHTIRQAAFGLQQAHEAGLVHRDIKPGNLLVDRTGTVKILDLGLALFFHEGDDNLTKNNEAQSVLGTADYLAPEQALNSHAVDIRADIYSLGVTFYFLLTGKGPFSEGTVAQKLVWHQLMQPQPIQELRPEVPEELAALVERMMAKEPADRFQAPAEVFEALLPWTEVPIDPPPAAEMPKLCPAAAGPAVPETSVTLTRMAALSAASSPSLHLTRGPGSSFSSTAGAGSTTHSAILTPAGPSDDDATMVLIQAEPAPEIVREQRRRTWLAWGTGGAALVVVCTAAAVLWQALGHANDRPTRSPDAPWAAGQAAPPRPGSVRLAGEVRRYEGHTDGVESLAISRDGRRAVTGGMDRTIRVWDVETGAELRRLSGHEAVIYGLALLPDGRRLLSCSPDRTIRLWDLETGQELRRYGDQSAGVNGLALAPDGRLFLTAGEDQALHLWDVETGQEVRRFEGHALPVWNVAFAPDGKQALSVGRDMVAILWDVETGRELRRFEGHTGEVRRAAFSPDGKRALTCSFDMTMRLWDVETGQELRNFDGRPYFVESVCFAPDGKTAISTEGPEPRNGQMIVGSDHGIRFWDLETGRQLNRLGGVPGKVFYATYCPDGRHILSVSLDKVMRLWLPGQREELSRR